MDLAGFEPQAQRGLSRDQSEGFEPQAELVHEAAQQEQQRFRRLDRFLEVERLVETFARPHEAQRTRRGDGSGREQPQRLEAEPFGDGGLPERQQFADIADAPLREDGRHMG